MNYIHLILLFVMISILLVIRVETPKKVLEGSPEIHRRFDGGSPLSKRNHLEDLKKARISPNHLYLVENNKPDKVLNGVWGNFTNATDFRSPVIQTKKKIQELSKKMKEEGTNEEFRKNIKLMEKLHQEQLHNHLLLSENQKKVFNALSDGQVVSTKIMGDTLEDEKLGLDEYTRTPHISHFNHRKYSIQTRAGPAERTMESSLIVQ